MEWLKENQALVMVILFLAVIALAVVVLVLCNKIYKNFYVKKFSFTDLLEETDGADTITLIIGNKSLNDVTVSALGMSNGLSSFDYIREYRRQANIQEGGKVVIPSRSTVSLRIDRKDVESAVMKDFALPPKKLSAYVIDAYGGLCKGKVRVISKQFKKDYKAYVKAEKQAAKERALAEKQELRREKAEFLTVKKLRDEKLTLFEKCFLRKYNKTNLK